MRALDRYVQGRVAGRYAVLLGVFVAVVIGGQLAAFIGRGAPPEALLPVLPAVLLLALPIAVPLALAAALLVAIGGMVRSGEFQALSAAGIAPRRVILRLWPFVLRTALLVALLAHIAMPLAIRDIRANKERILQAAIATRVANLRPIYDEEGVSAWAGQVNGRELRDVYIRRRHHGDDLAAFAPRAAWGLSRNGLEFRLEDVRLVQLRGDGGLFSGEAAHYLFQVERDEGLLDEPDAMGTPAVIAALDGPTGTPAERSRFNNSRLTLHLRLYLPVALFAYALFAAGLALVFAVSEGLAGVVVVVVVVAVATYPAIGYVKSGARLPQADPGILLWGPGIVLAVVGWWMLSRPGQVRELAARPLGALDRLRARLSTRKSRPPTLDGGRP